MVLYSWPWPEYSPGRPLKRRIFPRRAHCRMTGPGTPVAATASCSKTRSSGYRSARCTAHPRERRKPPAEAGGLESLRTHLCSDEGTVTYERSRRQVILGCSLGRGSVCEWQVKDFVACVLGGAASAAGSGRGDGDAYDASAGAGQCDGAFGAFAGDLPLALAGHGCDLVQEVGERGVVGGGPFDVDAECFDGLVALLLQVASPSRVAPAKVLVPVD